VIDGDHHQSSKTKDTIISTCQVKQILNLAVESTDTGHDNLCDRNFEGIRSVQDRLIAVHLHDNDGTFDQHNLIFSGTIDWQHVAEILSRSSYRKCVSMELVIGRQPIQDERIFLAKAYETGVKLTEMIAACRSSLDSPEATVELRN
jgi:hypothetical protein